MDTAVLFLARDQTPWDSGDGVWKFLGEKEEPRLRKTRVGTFGAALVSAVDLALLWKVAELGAGWSIGKMVREPPIPALP